MAIASQLRPLGPSPKRPKTSTLENPQLPKVETFRAVPISVVRSGRLIQIQILENGEESLGAIGTFVDDPQLADLDYNLTRGLDVSLRLEIMLPVEPTTIVLVAAAMIYQRIHAKSGLRLPILMGVDQGTEDQAQASGTKSPTRPPSRPPTRPPQIPPQFIPSDIAPPGQSLQLFLGWVAWTKRFNANDLRHVSQNFARKGMRVQDIARMKAWKWRQINISCVFGLQVSEAAKQYIAVLGEAVRDVPRWPRR